MRQLFMPYANNKGVDCLIGAFVVRCLETLVNILYLCSINSFKLPVEMYFMLATHQIVTTVLISLHRTDRRKLIMFSLIVK